VAEPSLDYGVYHLQQVLNIDGKSLDEFGLPRPVLDSQDTYSVRYGAGQGGFSLCDPAVTPARGQLFAIPPRPV